MKTIKIIIGLVVLATTAFNHSRAADNGVVETNATLLVTNNADGWANWRISFSSGAEFQNPYNISVPSGAKYGTLTNSGNNTVAYLQFEIMRRGVFAPDPLPDDLTNHFWDGITFLHPTKANWTPDLQFDVGFLLGNDNGLTNKSYSAQTLAGSDIYLNFAAGLPLWRNNWQSSDKVPVQVSLGYSIGVTTDEGFEQVHDNQFIGGVMDIGLDPKWISNSFTNVGNGLFEARFGEGYLDFPSMTGTNNQVNLNGNGEPKFNKKWVPEMSVNVLIPVTTALYLNIEANTFLANQTPGQWNVKVGVTVPWSTIGKTITGLGF